MAFEKIKFAMKTWKDAVSGGTPITAAELNRIEKGISDCATQTNTLGDSVSPLVSDGVITQITTSKDFGILLQILFTSYDGKKYSFSVAKSGLQVWNFTDSVTVWKYVK